MNAATTLPGKATALMRRAGWRHARRHPWQTWLSLAGIMLGVMMVVAVDLANSSASRAFDLSVSALSGNLTHQIVASSGAVDDEVFTALRTDLGIRTSAPAISGEVRVGQQRFTLVGLDPLSEATLARQRPGFAADPRQMLGLGLQAMATPRAVLMQDEAAAAMGLVPGDALTLAANGRSLDAELVAVLEGENSRAVEGIVFSDIALAQALLDRPGLDSIDLRLAPDQVNLVRQWLPSGLALVQAGSDNAVLKELSGAFQVNLMAMSLLALLVAALLIYNTVSLSVLERQGTLGVLRALGVEGGTLVRLVLLESLVLGVVASLAGVVLGLVLGQVLVRFVTRTMNDLYFTLTVTRFLLDYTVLLKGMLLGTGITVLAALLPALQAGNAPPITLQRIMPEQETWQRRTRWLALAGVVLWLAGQALLLPERGALVTGFVALNLIIFGFCLVIPWLLSRVLSLLLALLVHRLPQTLRLSLRNIQAGIGRTGLAVAALTVAVSVTVGVGVMTGSFRHTIVVWLDQTLGGDVQLSRLDEGSGIAPDLEQAALTLDGLQEPARQYLRVVRTDFGEVRVFAHDAPPEDSLYLRELDREGLQRFTAGEAILLAEPFAWQHQLTIGDSLNVYTDSGPRNMTVAGIYYDYTTGTGSLEMPLAQFRALWPEQGPQRLSFVLSPGADRAAVLQALRALTREVDGNYGVAANADIEAITMAIFDRTFAITDVLRLLAILVAFVGVLSALTALQLQRMREYALLRASGMTTGEVGGMILVQTLAMGLCAGLLALPLGLMMSDILIDVINRRSFGWSMQHVVPAAVLWQAVMLALAAALLAGIYPALRIRRLSPALALRQE